MTRSAPAAASAGAGDDFVAELQRRRALARLRANSSAMAMTRAAFLRRAARAIDEPISPMPMIATRSKIGAASGGPERSAHRPPARHEIRQRGDDAAIGLFAADRHAQAVRQAVGATARNTKPRALKKRSASFAVLPGVAGNCNSTKLPTLGVTLDRRALAISSVSHGSQRALCSAAVATCAWSSIAATPAAIAAPVDVERPAHPVQRVDDARRRVGPAERRLARP